MKLFVKLQEVEFFFLYKYIYIYIYILSNASSEENKVKMRTGIKWERSVMLLLLLQTLERKGTKRSR